VPAAPVVLGTANVPLAPVPVPAAPVVLGPGSVPMQVCFFVCNSFNPFNPFVTFFTALVGFFTSFFTIIVSEFFGPYGRHTFTLGSL
jgi:hypothetical protein